MPPIWNFNRDIRWKSYALSDHLGNIRATFSDMKLIDNMYPGFKVDLTSVSSFYPFGMEIPGRTWNNGTGYRYGWGGHEKDNACAERSRSKIKGEGNSIATHFRLNDPRTGRWFTTDPVTHFSQSPYVSMDNNPINLFDPNGADVFSDVGDAATSVASWVSDRATEAYEGVKDLLTGTADTPLAPGRKGLIDDVGDVLGSIEVGQPFNMEVVPEPEDEILQYDGYSSYSTNNSEYLETIKNTTASDIRNMKPLAEDWEDPSISYTFRTGFQIGIQFGDLFNAGLIINNTDILTGSKLNSVALTVVGMGFNFTEYKTVKKDIFLTNTPNYLQKTPIGSEYFIFKTNGLVMEFISQSKISTFHVIELVNGKQLIGKFEYNDPISIGIDAKLLFFGGGSEKIIE